MMAATAPMLISWTIDQCMLGRFMRSRSCIGWVGVEPGRSASTTMRNRSVHALPWGAPYGSTVSDCRRNDSTQKALAPIRIHALGMHRLPFCSALLNLYKSIQYFIYTFKRYICYTKRSTFGGKCTRLCDMNVCWFRDHTADNVNLMETLHSTICGSVFAPRGKERRGETN